MREASSFPAYRKARTRTLIQLGGLLEKTGMVETFGISLGSDLQKDLYHQASVAALTGALLLLKDTLEKEPISFSLLIQKGKEHLAQKHLSQGLKEEETRKT